jgi:hypothetical protein
MLLIKRDISFRWGYSPFLMVEDLATHDEIPQNSWFGL